MADFSQFASLERSGWQNQDIVAGYVDHLAPLTFRAGEKALAALDPGPETALLDLCCGQGNLTRRAAEMAGRVAGLDFSEAMLARAATTVPTADLRHGDAAAMPFADDSFDAVVCNFGMPHVPDRAAVLSEIARVLRSGGKVALTSWVGPEDSAAFGIAMSAIRAKAGPPSIPQPDMFEFSRRDAVEAQLASAGLQLEAHDPVPLALVYDAPDGLFEMFANATVGIRMLIQSQEPAIVTAIREAMSTAVERDYRASEGYCIPIPATVSIGRLL